MNEPLPIDLQEHLEQIPIDPARPSKLERYRDVILRWRRQGRSYRKIQQILVDECEVSVTYETLRRFVKLRTRPRKQTEPEVGAVETPAAVKPYQQTFDHAHARGKTRAEMLAFVAQEKAKPLAPKPVTEKVFEYTDEDASNPIKMLPKEK